MTSSAYLAMPGLIGLVAVLIAVTTSVNPGKALRLTLLPKANKKGRMSLEAALTRRRSIHSFKSDALAAEQISQLCWAAQGVSEQEKGYRTAPSAGAFYPLELYVVTSEGVLHYHPLPHALRPHLTGDVRSKLQEASLDQSFVGRAPAIFVITAVVSRTARRYGSRAERYVLMEAGHAAQNLLLQATALHLGALPVGAFIDNQVADILSLPQDRAPLYLLPVGVPVK